LKIFGISFSLFFFVIFTNLPGYFIHLILFATNGPFEGLRVRNRLFESLRVSDLELLGPQRLFECLRVRDRRRLRFSKPQSPESKVAEVLDGS
jgi:hypothetical protein